MSTSTAKIIKPRIVNTNTATYERATKIAEELHHPIIKKFERRKVIATEPDQIWAIDLCEMDPYDNYKYILTVIDVYTKYGWAIPLKSKKGITVAAAFDNIISASKRKPKLVWNDQGKEFWNKDFKTVLDKFNADMYNTQSELKSTVVERFNRTLKERMEKELTIFEILGKPRNWVEVLSKIIHDYNQHWHNTIKMSPIDAIKKENRKELDKNWDKHLNKNNKETKDKQDNVLSFKEVKENKFKVGDVVRIYRYKNIFEKGFKPRWTEEVFRIKRINYTTPQTYIIEDQNNEEIKGAFYEQELLKSNVKS